MQFIPAKESNFFIQFFYWYTRWLLFWRFESVKVHFEYLPPEGAKTVYFANHNYWWDGLLPLYLNERYFKQKARALMEDKQMRTFTFFRKIGAFSIDLNRPKASIRSLRYALESMKRDRACLFIYPEGSIVPVNAQKPDFKHGLAWLYQKSESIDFVPIAIYIDYSSSSKPTLQIKTGTPIKADKKCSKQELTTIFEEEVHRILSTLRNS